jgi:uncharacterized protein YhhL (DUF1145 family)
MDIKEKKGSIIPPPKSNFQSDAKLLFGRVSLNSILIAALLCCVAVSFFFKSYYRESVSDDLIYKYMVEAAPLGPASYTYQKVHNFSDVLISQSHQYRYLNGRTIVHIFVQMFTSVWGLGPFSVFNAILAIIAITVLVRLTQSAENRKSILMWTFVALALLYLFPSPAGLFYSMAGAFNYLLPITTSTIFFILLGKVKAGELSKTGIIIFSIFAFVAGWTMEAFTLPISGGLFFWLIINRKKVNFSIAPIIMFWIGTAILVLAPGNYVRLGSGGSRLTMLLQAFKYFGQIKLFWLMLIACIVYRIKNKNGFKAFCKQNQLYILIITISILFFCYVNTILQSSCCIEFMSFILLFKMLDKCFNGSTGNLPKCIISAVFILLISVHQYYIVQDCRTIQLQTQQLVADVVKLDAELMPKPEFHTSPLLAPFVNAWYSGPVSGWHEEVISIVYRHRKPFRLLDQKDYDALKNPEKFYISANIVDGDAHAYDGDKYYWLKADDLAGAHEVEFEYYPISWADVNSLPRALKFIFARGSYVESQRFAIPEKPEIANSQGMTTLSKTDRRVKAINIVR